MAITNTQQGVITEAEFAKIAILTSNGRLVPTRALADYTDPLFFIPSPFFHKHALQVVGRGTIQLQFKASMEANAKGMWTPFAVPQARLGTRILEILNSGLSGQPGLDPAVAQLIGLPGVVWLQRPMPAPASRRSLAA